MDDVGQQSSKVRPISIPENVIPEVIINGIPDWIYEGIDFERSTIIFAKTEFVDLRGNFEKR